MAATASPPNPALAELADPVMVLVGRGRIVEGPVDDGAGTVVEAAAAEQAPWDWNPTVIHWLQNPKEKKKKKKEKAR